MNNFISELLFVLFALVIVSLFAWLVFRAMKSMHPGKYKPGKITILASAPIGARERIVVVRHHDKEYMLGVTAGGVSLLDKFAVNNPMNPEKDQ